MHILYSIYFIIALMFVVFSPKHSVNASEYYYEVETPYRSSLQEQYVDESLEEYYIKPKTVSSLRENYLKRKNKINTDMKNAKKEQDLKSALATTADVIGEPIKTEEQQMVKNVLTMNNVGTQDSLNEKQPSKRDLMLQGKDSSKQDKEEKNKVEGTKTSWIDSWLVYKDVKPMDYIGAYSIFKLLFTWPAGMKFSSNETRTVGEKQISAELFNGSADMGFMPAFFISAGNDRFKFWRWEVELGYIPLRVSEIKLLEMNTVDNPGSSFIVSKKNLGTHFINLNFNNYVQFAFFDKSIVTFFGIGLGIGYAWSFDRSRLSSNFVLPVISAYFGFTFMISKTRKMNISYRLSYADFSISNKYAWPDKNKVLSDSRPIVGGKTSFKDLFISAISIEYMFYIN